MCERYKRLGLSVALLLSLLVGLQTNSLDAFAATGDTDSALSLNGTTQYAEVSDPGTSAFDLTGNMTLEAWVYPTSTCTNDQAVISKYYSYMLYCGSSGYWKYALSSNGLGWTGATTSIQIEPNAWHHIAFTHQSSSTNLVFYYDGQLVETYTAGVSTMTANDQPFDIGRYNSANYFQGKIDEVRVYSASRSASQIASDMKTWGPANDSSLVAYYDFNDQSGATISNVATSPAANTNLTTYGSPTYSNVETTTTINGDLVVTFPRSYLNSNGGWKIPSNVSTLRSLVIAGGGSGGSRAGGGGGAGGYVYDSALSVTPNSYQSIVVGTGGYGFISRQGRNGLNSSLGTLRTALGGGGGGHAGGADNITRVGLNGGSGGGASGDYYNANSSAAFGYGQQNSTYGYGSGNNGGSGYSGSSWPSGGGGGANLSTGVGGNSNGSTSVGGKGGNGISDPLGGTTTCYATGGGGGTYTSTTPGAGGDCSGSATPNGNAGTAGQGAFPGYARANTGSGGGGGGWDTGNSIGGFGASGVIVLRYPLSMTISLTYSGGTSATYRSSGLITASASLAGKITFYERGKPISGCKNRALDASNTATCAWKPSIHGNVLISATATPTNTYVASNSTSMNLTVNKRTNQR